MAIWGSFNLLLKPHDKSKPIIDDVIAVAVIVADAKWYGNRYATSNQIGYGKVYGGHLHCKLPQIELR